MSEESLVSLGESMELWTQAFEVHNRYVVGNVDGNIIGFEVEDCHLLGTSPNHGTCDSRVCSSWEGANSDI